MIAEVTSAALMSENKQMSHPASVDSTPTSANQEDHVSMACHGARRLLQMTENLFGIIGIEAITAAQGVDFRAPLKTSPELVKAVEAIRSVVQTWRPTASWPATLPRRANWSPRAGSMPASRQASCRNWHD